eukprot:805828-Prymnesium_polylepis.1
MKRRGIRKDELRGHLPKDFDLEGFIESQKMAQKEYSKHEQMVELTRLVLLVSSGAEDPNTGKAARMPSQSDKNLGLGMLWDSMKRRGNRKDELRGHLPPGFDLEAFIKSCKRKQKQDV